MDHLRHPHDASDLSFGLVQARIESHQADAVESRRIGSTDGPVRRTRNALGGAIIALGRAISVPVEPRREAATR